MFGGYRMSLSKIGRGWPLIIPIAFVLAFGFFGDSIQKLSPPTNLEKHHSYSENQNKKHKGKESESLREIVDSFFTKTFEDPVAFFTLWLVVFTALLARATLRLWDSTERLVKGAEDTAQRQLRAYISVDAPDNMPAIIGDKISIILQITNDGQTPAYNVLAYPRVAIASIPLTEGLPEAVVESRKKTLGDLNPKARVFQSGEIAAPNQQVMEAIRNGTKGIYFYGEVKFVDTFNKNQWVKFCVMLGFEENGRLAGLIHCPEGNQSS
jgi:hypothetical protein